MTTILLISEDYVKTNSGLDDNVYGKFLMPAIKEAQEIGLQSIIGGNLYDAVLARVEDGSIQDDFDYKYLLDKHIQPYLLYKTIVDLLPIIGTKIANIGTVVANDEHVVNLPKNDRDNLQTYYQYRADFYCRRMQEYLCKNSMLYPELNDCDCDRIKANLTSAASCPIWLGGMR